MSFCLDQEDLPSKFTNEKSPKHFINLNHVALITSISHERHTIFTYVRIASEKSAESIEFSTFLDNRTEEGILYYEHVN